MGDIYSNIVIAAPQLTLDDAWEAARLASVADDIRAMPMGMQTLISEGQGGISGGQRQRLMIARAVVAKPRILMFDEATSALDNVTQRHVSDAIDSLKDKAVLILKACESGAKFFSSMGAALKVDPTQVRVALQMQYGL